MSLLELFLLAVGLSMDAFAVSVCIGLTMPKTSVRKALVVGLYFGIFQAGMPVIGYFAARLFADKIIAFDHWIAFGLLGFLGVRMIIGGLQKDESESGGGETREASVSPRQILPLAVSTSIDAMAVGVSFAFIGNVNVVSAVGLIGVTTFALSMLGVKIGNVFGAKFKSKAEIAGGVILILIGVKILVEELL